jgi:hypothetical protein
MEPPKSIVFNGIEYKLMGAGKYYLSQSRSNEGRRNAKGLHVAIWEHHNGKPVPKGYHVHHEDEDTFNNDISNLELVKKGAHLGVHSKKWHADNKEKSKEMMSNIRERAAEWHKSDAGKKWHSEQSKNSWATTRKIHKGVCGFCGVEFESKFSDVKYCSQKCRTKANIEKVKYDYDGICTICGNEFTATRLSKTRPKRETCSRTCQNRLVHRNRKDRKQ